MNLPLFSDPTCDHLPVGSRLLVGDYLVCHKCGKKLRRKDFKPDPEIDGKTPR